MNQLGYQAHQKTCTTILVGKRATIDGSTMIARNEDGGDEPNPQKFVVYPANTAGTVYESGANHVKIPLPENSFRYTAKPDADDSFGVWAGAGINSQNVAMTATETSTTNTRVLAADPLVDVGIGEADITTLVLPYIKSAREGVTRLGQLLKTYGTYESNGIAFSDQEEVWYFESIGGHHWAAIRIPDDAFVVAPNRFNIDYFDFNSEDTMSSADLEQFITDHHLNPDIDTTTPNLRHIFGSASDKDRVYNNPRAWYVHRLFAKDATNEQPEDQDLPFIVYPKKKLSVDDVKFALSSHYQGTAFDPYEHEQASLKYRPIGINRNQESHILQIRPNMPTDIAGVHWLGYGPNTFNAFVPFYVSVTTTPASFEKTTPTFDVSTSYWLTRVIAVIADKDFATYQDMQARFEQQIVADNVNLQQQTDQAIQAGQTVDLESVNQKMADNYMLAANTLLGKMTKLGTKKMQLRFSVDD
ncbi:C69 family dipeptidase [Weissella thailandensis]|uniref:Dipeptidase n=1 Tax=Weissella thailandensis TaxID=89061 RepID=A0ABX9I5Q9_9LACO|nr:C69 family dipeptidase [Weissella thailandensis]NKY90695.1 C69 family dipeptidase [Weissella thailandensis]RDS59907.1 dipeptidase [Weissella thailandensis]GEP74008.1 dipeptidase [Weissella thailandensis]